MTISQNGEVVREDGVTKVRIAGKAHLLSIEGVTCLNPDAPEPERIYEKSFKRKRVLLPGDADALKVLQGENVVVLGMTGYSSIKPADCQAWGIQPGAYEAACARLLTTVIDQLRAEFPGIDLRIADGASDMGVDKVIMDVAVAKNIPHLGFSCPNFMFYVKDDDLPVYVGPSQAEYADAFIRALNILIGANGRMQALEHDMVAAIKYNKRLILANVLKAISTNGGPPARDAEGKVIDATAAFQQCITSLVPRGQYSSDPFADLETELVTAATRVTRGLLPPALAYGGRK